MLVIFVAPFFSPAATQMIEAALALAHIRVAVIAQQPLAELAPAVAARLVGHWRVDDVTDAAQLEWAVQSLARTHGAVARCFAAYEQTQLPLATVRERLGIPGLPSTAAHNFRDKARMKDVLRAAGVPVARHQLVQHPADARQFVSDVGFPIVVKPPAGAGAKATERIRSVEELESALVRFAPSATDPMLAEEFLRGTEHSLETVSINGRPVALAHPVCAHSARSPRESVDPVDRAAPTRNRRSRLSRHQGHWRPRFARLGYDHRRLAL